MMKKSEPKILFLDIETAPIKVWTFGLGEQHISHKQIVAGYKPDIICIGYCWNKGPAKCIDWGLKTQDSAKVIREFDKIAKEADIIIGQNSDSFDVKHINTHRMLHGLEPMPDWADCSDDTLKQFRRHFKFTSNKLDYVSSLLGYGGKDPMELNDWIGVMEKDKKALDKMVRYCKKDVIQTRDIYNKIKPYIKPKLNMAAYYNDQGVCVNCGSKNIRKNGTRLAGQTRYQHFYCQGHGGHAGKAAILKNGNLGKLR